MALSRAHLLSFWLRALTTIANHPAIQAPVDGSVIYDYYEYSFQTLGAGFSLAFSS